MDNRRRPMVVRVALVGAGVGMVLAGIAGLVLPVVPGWLLIFSGLAVLAGEFVWARTLLDTAKAKAGEVASKLPTKGKNRAA
ncbi:MAG: PGPGW domain-containing protein [Acidimicrobiia bacterium]